MKTSLAIVLAAAAHVEQRVHCSIPRRDHQRRHGRRVCGIARWIDGYRRLACAAACPGDRIVAAEGRKAIAPEISMVRAMVMVSPSPAGHADSFDRVATISARGGSAMRPLRTWAAWSGASHHGFSPQM